MFEEFNSSTPVLELMFKVKVLYRKAGAIHSLMTLLELEHTF